MKPVVGLTGGIASGKSAVSKIFESLGIPVVDADKLARDVVLPGTPGLAAVVALFGERVLLPDGHLNRAALGDIVFADQEARLSLNKILHPQIAMASAHALQSHESVSCPYLIYDAALLVENGLHRTMRAVIVVDVPVEVQLERLCLRDGLSQRDAMQRISSQLSREERRRAATFVVDNSGSLDATRAQVEAIDQALRSLVSECAP